MARYYVYKMTCLSATHHPEVVLKLSGGKFPDKSKYPVPKIYMCELR